MKNILFILGFTAVLLACTKEAESVGSSAEDSPITLNLSISSASPDTKSIKQDWDHGDVIYVFFQGHILSDNAKGEQYLTAAYDKNGSVTGKSGTWYVKKWYGELDKEITRNSKGKLAAIYYPNDKVGGTLDVMYTTRIVGDATEDGIDGIFLQAKDRKGKDFYTSYFTYSHGCNYTVNNWGELTAEIGMLGSHKEGKVIQYCIKRDRDGNMFKNSEAHRYTLSHRHATTKPYAEHLTYDPIVVNAPLDITIRAGFDQWDYNDYLNAYFYGGLCFSGTAMSEYKSSESYKTEFRLIDNKDTDDTRDDVAYHYVASHIYMGELAFTLPDLNAKDLNGNYLWVVK